MRALVGDDDGAVEAAAGFLHPGHAALHRGGRRDPARASAISPRPRSCWPRAAIPVSRSPAWWRRTSRSPRRIGDVTAELLKQLGMNVDFVATDWGTVGSRRAVKTPPGQGGWGMFRSWHAGADCLNPAAYTAIRATGDKAWFGWPTIEAVEKEVAAWFDAEDARRGKGRGRAASTQRRSRRSSMRRPASS